MTKRLAITLTSIIVAALIACTVIVAVIVSNMTAAGQEADYRACVEAKGIYQETTSEGMAPIAESCYAAVYGE